MYKGTTKRQLCIDNIIDECNYLNCKFSHNEYELELFKCFKTNCECDGIHFQENENTKKKKVFEKKRQKIIGEYELNSSNWADMTFDWQACSLCKCGNIRQLIDLFNTDGFIITKKMIFLSNKYRYYNILLWLRTKAINL